MEKLWCLSSCIESSTEVLLRAEDTELLEFMVGVVQDRLVAEKLLELTQQPSCEMWLLLEVRKVELPLLVKKTGRCGQQG